MSPTSKFLTGLRHLEFTNIGQPTESLLLASLLVKQQIKLVWPYRQSSIIGKARTNDRRIVYVWSTDKFTEIGWAN